jgi:uncharacterized membrane protein YgcG
MTTTTPFESLRFSCLIQTLGRRAGDGIAFLTVAAGNPADAETAARRLAEARFGCLCDVTDIVAVAA